jgi:hypothetical protein
MCVDSCVQRTLRLCDATIALTSDESAVRVERGKQTLFVRARALSQVDGAFTDVPTQA